jgi:hypothetical protein
VACSRRPPAAPARPPGPRGLRSAPCAACRCIRAQPSVAASTRLARSGSSKIGGADVGLKAPGDQRDHVHERLGGLAALGRQMADLFQRQDVTGSTGAGWLPRRASSIRYLACCTRAGGRKFRSCKSSRSYRETPSQLIAGKTSTPIGALSPEEFRRQRRYGRTGVVRDGKPRLPAMPNY